MTILTGLGLLALAAMLVLEPAWAQREGSPPAAACPAPEREGHPLGGREDRLARYQALPEHCLKHLVLACNQQATEQLLDAGSAASCSIGYEALLKQGFKGDFQAMLAWWRNRPAAAVR